MAISVGGTSPYFPTYAAGGIGRTQSASPRVANSAGGDFKAVLVRAVDQVDAVAPVKPVAKASYQEGLETYRARKSAIEAQYKNVMSRAQNTMYGYGGDGQKYNYDMAGLNFEAYAG